DVIAPLSRRKHFKLGGKIFLPLLREDRSIDRPAGTVPMTGGAGWNVSVRVAKLDQLDDGICCRRERHRIWIAHRLARVISRDSGDGIFVECLGEISHELIGSTAAVIIIELFVNCSAGLAGQVWKFR